MPKTVVLPIIHENKLVGEVCLNGHGGSLLRFLLRGMVACLVAQYPVCAGIVAPDAGRHRQIAG